MLKKVSAKRSGTASPKLAKRDKIVKATKDGATIKKDKVKSSKSSALTARSPLVAEKAASGKKGAANSKTPKRLYGAIVEKGDNQWKREWSGFMNGVRMSAEGASVKLPQCMDYEQQAESSFSYLFTSPAQKKAERDAKRKEVEKKQKEVRAEALKKRKLKKQRDGLDDDEDEDRSKMQKAIADAQKRGLNLVGMNRHEKRQFLHLTVTEEQQRMEEQQKELKPQDMMDPKLQWYQQGPFPIDLIAEKLIIKKAIKHAKQQSLRYNYLTVHPSWVASRARRRKEDKVVPYGVHFSIDDKDGNEQDETSLKMRIAMELAKRVQESSFQDSRIAAALGRAQRADVGDGVAQPVAVPVGRGGVGGVIGGAALLRANLSTNYISSNVLRGEPTSS